MSINKVSIQRQTFDIINGPNKDFLVDAFKYAYAPRSTISITFGVLGISMINTRITMLEYFNEKGETVYIKGDCKACIRSANGPYEPYKFEATYNTKIRSGKITFEFDR